VEVQLQCPACEGYVTVHDMGLFDADTVVCTSCGMDIPVTPANRDELERSPQRKAVSAVEPVQFTTRRRNVIDDEMDMTPMVDVTFLLLIFFMVTAAFSLQRAFEVPAPDPNQPSTIQPLEIDEDPDFVTIRVDAYNTYYVSTSEWEEEAPSEQELRIRLREAVRSDPKDVVPTKLLVKAHGDALWEKVVTALDAGAEVGMQEVKMVTVEEDE